MRRCLCLKNLKSLKKAKKKKKTTMSEQETFLIYANCHKCGKRFKFHANQYTRYWICPNCKTLNGCLNLIKKILVDTVYPAEEEEKEPE